MKIITTHIYADLDALSSMVMAKKLYPDAVMVFPGNISMNVKKFITLYQDFLNIEKVKDIDFDQIEELIVVDTSKKNRIGRFGDVVDRIKSVKVYDHHPEAPEDIEAPIIRKEYGSNTSHMVEILKEVLGDDLTFETYELNAGLMGIYEDTGNFTYSNTRSIDLETAGYLLKLGGDIKVVHEYITKGIREDQKEVFLKLIEAGEILEFSVERIFLTKYYSEDFIGGVDELINKIKELEECSACFIICGNDEKANIIGRSSSMGVRLDEILEGFQGGGHWNASSVIARDTPFDKLYKDVRELILKNIKIGKLARDIMSTPVKTIERDTRLKDAYKLMKKFGYTGLPIVDEGRLCGIISRRDVDRAIGHGFANAPVRVYMSTGIVWAAEEDSLEEIKRKLVENEIGRVPILREGALIGIVTRADVLRHLFAQRQRTNKGLREEARILREGIIDGIGPELRKILESIRETAAREGVKAYLVGGIVRDIILGIENEDIDIVVEGNGIEFAKSLCESLGGKKVVSHEKFKTAVVVVDENLKIDVATSRVEYYEYPTSLPTVEYGSLREDMFRRDFTINSLALEVDNNRFGDLVDYFNGYKDIREKKIRILHNLSFIEDPTRIIRAFRFASRYGFDIAVETERLLQDSIENGFLKRVSWPRVKTELKIILGDRRPQRALEYLEKYGILKTIHPKIRYSSRMKEQIEKTADLKRLLDTLGLEKWLVNFLVVLENLNSDELNLVFSKFGFSGSFKKKYHLGSTKRKKILKELSIARKNSRIYDILKEITNEIIVLLYLEGNQDLKENIEKYVYSLRNAECIVGGRDLIEMGGTPGDHFKDILQEVFYFQLDNPESEKEELLKKLEEKFRKK